MFGASFPCRNQQGGCDNDDSDIEDEEVDDNVLN